MAMIIPLIIIGIAAGFVATRLMRVEADIITTAVVGMAGALLGGFVLRTLIFAGGMVGGLVGATLGAMALVWFWQKMKGR